MLGRVSSAIGAALQRLNPRERVLLGVLGLVALAMAAVLAVLVTNRSLGRLEREVSSQTEALKALRDKAPEIRASLEAGKSGPGASGPECPALGTQLEAHASSAGLGDAALEMVDQPEEVVAGWVRKSVQVRLRRQQLGKLADFWARTDNDRARYQVAITKLNVRRRRLEDDSYDVEMVASCYAPSKEQAPAKAEGRGRPSDETKAPGKRSKG